jgi:hypothetical protein
MRHDFLSAFVGHLDISRFATADIVASRAWVRQQRQLRPAVPAGAGVIRCPRCTTWTSRRLATPRLASCKLLPRILAILLQGIQPSADRPDAPGPDVSRGP